MLGVQNKTIHKLLKAPHIKTRAMYLEKKTNPGDGSILPIEHETPQRLNNKFISGLEDIGVQAAKQSTTEACVSPQDIDAVVGASSGVALPGFSAILIREVGLRSYVQRSDIVGMRFNAGMSGLRALSYMIRDLSRRCDPSTKGLLVCCEINSAIYVNNESKGVGVVNSLFGDLVPSSSKVSAAVPILSQYQDLKPNA